MIHQSMSGDMTFEGKTIVLLMTLDRYYMEYPRAQDMILLVV